MADDTTNPPTDNVTEMPKPNDSAGNLLAQVMNEMKKGQNDAAKTKLREKLKAKAEHQKAIALIDREIQQIIADHSAGLL